MIGRRITTLNQLYVLALKRKSIVYGYRLKPVPAAFVIGWPGRTLYNLLQSGVYLYVRTAKVSKQ